MNLDPAIWGPHAWFFLDSIIITMPDKLDKNQILLYGNFFKSLQYLLPCKACKLHYSLHLEKFPLTDEILSTKASMLEWIVNLHNEVRKNQNKSQRTINSVLTYYKNIYTQEKHMKMEYYILIIISIFLLCKIFKL
jgi:hypothetical protein